MEDNLNVTCSDIRKKLKAFLDDLLAEDEYRALVAHLDHCKECKDYVRKIGAISNQLWELGDIKAPSDLGSTILFRLKQAEEEIRKPKFVISKKLSIEILVVTLAVPLIFLGVYHLKSRKQPRETDETPTIEVYVERKPAISDREAESLLGKLKDIAARLGLSEKERTVGNGTGREEEAVEETAGKTTPIREKALVPEPKPLHWHFLYADETKELNLKREKGKQGLELKKKTDKTRQLDDEIERLKKEKNRIDYESQPFGTVETAALEEQRKALELKIQEKLKEKEKNNEAIKRLEDNIRESERTLQQYKREEAERKTGLMNAVNSSGIIIDYQTDNLLVFAAKGEKIENLLEKIYLISPGSSSLRDYTPRVSVDPNQEYRVSVYLEKETASVRHWHIACSAIQKQRLLGAIPEESGRINYESEKVLVFFIPKDAVEKLKARILSMGIDFSEFAYAEFKEDLLQSGPVEISIYISNR